MQLEEVKKYYDNGKLANHYFIDDQYRIQGKCISYFPTGISISLEANYKNDKCHGKYISYNSDGTIYIIKYYWYGKFVTKAEFLRLKYDEVMKCS